MAEVLTNRVLLDLIFTYQDGMPGALTLLDYTWKHCIMFIRGVREFKFNYEGVETLGSDLFLQKIDCRFPIHFALYKGDHNLALFYAKSFTQELLSLDQNSALMSCASKYGALAVVQWLHLNQFTIDKSAMDAAAGNGHFDVVQYLHQTASAGCTFRAINWAAANGYLNIVQFLHTYRNEGGTDSGLVAAAGNGHLLVVQFLYSVAGLSLSAEAFLAAATENHLDVMEYLLDIVDFHPQVIAVAVTRAIKNKRSDIVKYLIETKGIRQEYWKTLAIPRDMATFQCLVDFEIAFPLVEMNQLLLEADLTLLQAMWTYAVSRGYSHPFTSASLDNAICCASLDETIRLEMINFLYEKGVTCSTQSILGTALSKGFLKIALFLREIYGLQFLPDCLCQATCSGDIDVVQNLYELMGESIPSACLDMAAAKGNLEIVKFIHEHRNQGCTTRAMDCAAANGHFEVVHFLATNRTESCTTDAVDKAAEAGHLNIVEYLTSLGKPATWKAIDGAAINGHFEVVQYLLQHRDEGFTQAAILNTLSLKIRKVLLLSKKQLTLQQRLRNAIITPVKYL